MRAESILRKWEFEKNNTKRDFLEIFGKNKSLREARRKIWGILGTFSIFQGRNEAKTKHTIRKNKTPPQHSWKKEEPVREFSKKKSGK